MNKLYYEILNDIDDLPRCKQLAKKIYHYVKNHKYYNLAVIGSIIDDFYNYSCGLSIAGEIHALF